MKISRYLLPTLALLALALHVQSQNQPIGSWQSHIPYNVGVGVATDGNTLYAICAQPFFTYNPAKNNLEPFSKVNGMSDIGMQQVSYDQATGITVLVYNDGNIDLYKNNSFFNIPDLKLKVVAGSKAVSQVYCENGVAYLSTPIGVLVIDLTNYDIAETYQFVQNNQNIPILGFAGNGDYFYAITATDVYRALKTNPQLQNFAVWQHVDSTHSFIDIASVNGILFFSNHYGLWASKNDSIRQLYATVLFGPDSASIQHIDAGNSGLLISEFHPKTYSGIVRVMDTSFNYVDSCPNLGNPLQATQLLDNSIWIADNYYGLENRSGSNGVHIPPGPDQPDASDIYAYNSNVWVVHGVLDDKLDWQNIPQVASNYVNGNWVEYERYVYSCFNDVNMGVVVKKDQVNGTVYIGSFRNGLQIIKPDGTCQQVNNAAIFDSSSSLTQAGLRQVAGISIDQNENLWVSTAFSQHQLYARSATDSAWYKFLIPIGALNGGPTLVDDNGQVWMISYFTVGAPGGVVVYNYNNTLSDPSDDTYQHLSTGAGSGNLPSNNVFCMAKDKNNNIWIGTDNGIGIVSNCSVSSSQTTVCDAVEPIVQYDQFAGYLFAGNNVRTIAVDGANRKWVGTDNGVWLLSPDASKIVYRFTVDNSPLPSNNIEKIAVDPVTGDTYIGTDMGLVSFRSTATDTNSLTSKVMIYPNPVPKEYNGTIAVNGLSLNADVRITDINDQLVYKTTALGGQAVWNGKDYKGHKPQSGVYLIFATSPDGSQTYAGKIVFIQ